MLYGCDQSQFNIDHLEMNMYGRERSEKKKMKEKGRKEKVNKIELLRHDIFIHALLVKQTLTLLFVSASAAVYYVQRVWG